MDGPIIECEPSSRTFVEAFTPTFIRESLDNLYETSRRGFAVNFMKRLAGTSGRKGLYYAEPADWARYCANRFGAATEVREDYGMRESTLIVRIFGQKAKSSSN